MAKSKRDTRHNKELGARGEEAAAHFLRRQGCEILEQGFTCKAGEADIIARDDSSIRFIEVKTRMSNDTGFPEESVDQKKRRKYERIAESYLSTYEGEDIGITFDIIAINVLNNDRALLRMYRNVLACDCR